MAVPRNRRILVAFAIVMSSSVGTWSWHQPVAQLASGAASDSVESLHGVAAATFVGRETCAMCHDGEAELWDGSHHDLAMQPANENTVLGDFDNATFTHFGVASTFSRRDGMFFVRTEGPDGELADYEITHTFGVEPLQQYLVPFSNGRMQVLTICWDSRPKDEGGQRWFHLHPDTRIEPGQQLHWTGPDFNWNFMCAECHSTNLQKNYDRERDTFATTWSEIDVACEACHGPGSQHVAWVESGSSGNVRLDASKGLLVRHNDETPPLWEMDLATGTALPQTQRSTQGMETCARCHSRRAVLDDEYQFGQPLLQTHRLALLDVDLYHADGQILDEVYVHGSFLQSKMYAAGVRCNDCHQPHSLQLRREGNRLCAACHLPEKFDTPAHHFHAAGSPGSRCVDCHMPEQTYMVVDPRRDHSLRIPRPDLSVELGTPNACNSCHSDRDAQWAAKTVREWYGDARAGEPHYARALHAGRTGAAGAASMLVGVIEDTTTTAIVRATAASLLRNNQDANTVSVLQRAVRDAEPLVRMGAAAGLEALGPPARLAIAAELLSDPVRAVRLQAATTLASTPDELLDAASRQRLDGALAEYRHSQEMNADRAEAYYNLGWLDDQRGSFDAAEASYKTAIRRDPTFTGAYVNLADVYRRQDRDADGESVLRQGIAVSPGDGGLHHALGLLLVRSGRNDAALAEFEKAATMSPETPRYSYVFGIALHSAGQAERAVSVLTGAHERHPNDRQLLVGLATLSRDAGDTAAALNWAERLLALSPGDAQVRAFVEQLRRQSP